MQMKKDTVYPQRKWSKETKQRGLPVLAFVLATLQLSAWGGSAIEGCPEDTEWQDAQSLSPAPFHCHLPKPHESKAVSRPCQERQSPVDPHIPPGATMKRAKW